MTRTAETKQTNTLRCAIYTRKSTDEGLEQDYNSLDAQRDSGEAYIASQKHEGWVCLPTRYDDGGFTGGNLERPALQRLLADIEDGKIDCIVVYKVDRLSRSLIDFSKIMDVLDRNHVAFVSVTQQFNTNTSMGRLMLNVLLSFAQFEREIISERTRDKIAAARRKGKWTGGPPVLGYDRIRDNRGSRIEVNKDEAERVRAIYRMYLEQGSMLPTVQSLKALGWKTKRYETAKGKWRGGAEFDKSALQNLLTNVVYLGKVTYIHHRPNGIEDQAGFICDTIIPEAIKRRDGRQMGDIAVLYRNQYDGNEIAKAVEARGWDFIRIDQGNPYQAGRESIL